MSYPARPSKTVKIASNAIHQGNTGHAEPKSNFHHETPLAPTFTVGRSPNVDRVTRSLEGFVSPKLSPVPNSTWENKKSPTATTAPISTPVLHVSSPLDEIPFSASSSRWTGLPVASAPLPLPNTLRPQSTRSQSMRLEIPSIQYALPTEHESRQGKQPTTLAGLSQSAKPIILPSAALGKVQPVSSVTQLNSQNRTSQVAEVKASASPYQSSLTINPTVNLVPQGTGVPISSDLQPTDDPSVRYTITTGSLHDGRPTNPVHPETSIQTATASFLVDAGSGMSQKTGSATLKVVSGSVVAGLVTLGGLFLLLRCLIIRRHASIPDRTSMMAREYRDLIGHHYTVGHRSSQQTAF